MFNEVSSTYSHQHFTRLFTFSDLFKSSDNTITLDNKTFVGDNLVITFNN